MANKPKPPLNTDDKYIAGVKRIDATPENIALALRRPKTKAKSRKEKLRPSIL